MADIIKLKYGDGDFRLHTSPITETVNYPITWYKYASDAGGYYVKGLWMCPMRGKTSKYPYPWDLGVPNGALKDVSEFGWNRWGMVVDGNNKNLTAGMNVPFNKSNFTQWGIGITIWTGTSNYTDDSGRACLDFGDAPVTITFLDNRFDDYTWIGGDGSVYEWSEDKRTIVIYRVGPSMIVCRSENEDMSYQKICKDIKDIPANLDGMSQYTGAMAGTSVDYKNKHDAEYLTAYLKDSIVLQKEKTVTNQIVKQYGGIEKSISYPDTVFDEKTITVIPPNENNVLPDAKELVDIYVDGEISIDKWNLSNLRLEVKALNSETYVDWINKYIQSLEGTINVDTEDGNWTDNIYVALLAGLYINNETPIVLDVSKRPGVNNNGDSMGKLIVLDGLLCDVDKKFSTRGSSYIKNLQIIDTNKEISVLKRAFRWATVGLDIVHTLIPHTLDDTFSGTALLHCPIRENGEIVGYANNEILAHWFDWSQIDTIQYVTDGGAGITAIRGNQEIGLGIRFGQNNPNTSTALDAYGNENKYFRWPTYYDRTAIYDEEGAQIAWEYSESSITGPLQAVQAFNCSTIQIIEPIIPCKFFAIQSDVIKMLSTGIKSVRLKGINNFSWDFVNYLNCPLLDNDSIAYMIENAEDQITTPYDANYAPDWNIHSSFGTTDIRFDYIHIRSSLSTQGLYINFNANCMRRPTWSSFSGGASKGTFAATLTDRIAEMPSTNANLNTGTLYKNIGVLENVKFKVEGLLEGDTLHVGSYYNTNKSIGITENGIYKITASPGEVLIVLKKDGDDWVELDARDEVTTVSDYIRFRLQNTDTSIVDAVTITLLANTDGDSVMNGIKYPVPALTPELIQTANDKGWAIKIGDVEYTPETITEWYD